MSTEKIDFVMLWVDGNDPAWRKEKNKYSPNTNTDSRNIRYRDWEILKYWFRGVEKFAPWVNKVYFVTWGHLPKWLNTNSEKLVVVNHKDYIPKEYLPTFSSHPIELNLHRIKGLSEQFVYFNDDIFILNKLKPTDFFVNGMPCGTAVFNPPSTEENLFLSILYNNNLLINRNFEKNEIWKKHKFKYINYRYGKYNMRTILCLPWKLIQGFREFHTPISLLKSTFFEVWEKEEEILKATSSHKFRCADDVNQYIFKNWQFCKGNFMPSKLNFKFVKLNSNYNSISKIITGQKYKVICFNDDETIENFDEIKKTLIRSFETVFPEKSSFEK